MPRLPVRPDKTADRANSQGKRVTNEILLALPDNEYRSLRPVLEFLTMPNHRILYEPNRKIKFIYFLNSGLISLVIEMRDGKTVEVGIVGREGFAGAPSTFGLEKSPVREVVQIAGEGFRVRVAAFHRSLRNSPRMLALLGRYTMVLGFQVSQTAGCNRLHEIECRLSRWLLMAQDRIDSVRIAITHDFLATMLGTDRPTVSLAAASLQKRDIINYTRGAVRILDRKKLEESSCECYSVIQRFNSVDWLK